MKRYKPLQEKVMKEYKAWYSPSSNKFIQFSYNSLHGDIAEQKLKIAETDAIRKGYIRIAVHNGVNIESWSEPDDREFKAIQDKIDMNTVKGQPQTLWDVLSKSEYRYFPKDSFFYANEFKEGQLR